MRSSLCTFFAVFLFLAFCACAGRTHRPSAPNAPLTPVQRDSACPRLANQQIGDLTYVYDSATVDSLPRIIAFGQYVPPTNWHLRSGYPVRIPIVYVVDQDGHVEPESARGPIPAAREESQLIQAVLHHVRTSEFCPGSRAGRRVRTRMNESVTIQTERW